MMQSSLAHLARRIGGANMTAEAAFHGVSTNSRDIAPGNLFVALRGERFDAHDFLDQVEKSGAAAVVVEKLPPGYSLPALVVPDTRRALGEIASFWRSQFKIPLIAVTGSNGKTTVKEMIASVLKAEFGEDNVLATRGNFNNDIGVPLTLFRLEAGHKAAVLELGMNHPGEIALLSAIAQPSVGLVNNAQREHQEFMASVEAVAVENGSVIKALPSRGVAVFPADDTFTPLWRGYARNGSHRKMLSFGLNEEADVSCTWTPSEFGSDLQVKVKEHSFPLRLQAAGAHNVRNALAAIACCLAIGVHRKAIVRGLEEFAPVAGRLQKKQGSGGAVVIDDTYNANPDSVRAAIDVLAQCPAPRSLVLGDMGEVGQEGRQFHIEIGAYARGRGIENLLTLGELAQHASLAFGAHARHCEDMETLQQAAAALAKPGTTLLIKGSRFMKMERVVQHLTGESRGKPGQEAH